MKVSFKLILKGDRSLVSNSKSDRSTHHFKLSAGSFLALLQTAIVTTLVVQTIAIAIEEYH